MNCERYQNELEDFLYGELAEKRAAEIRMHLIECSDCAALRAQLERENEIFAQFYEETAMEPAREVWDAIRARIDAEPRRVTEARSGWSITLGWLWRPAILRQVAFAMLLVALSVAATIYFTRRGDDKKQNVAGENKVTPAPQPVVSPSLVPPPSVDVAQQPNATATPRSYVQPPTQLAIRKEATRPPTEQQLINQQIARAEREYQGAIRLLDRAIARRRDSLGPNLIREYESSLALIDDSIAKSRRALREQPNDVTAGQFLLAAYAKKVELMQDIAMQ